MKAFKDQGQTWLKKGLKFFLPRKSLDFLKARPESLGETLPYEDVFNDEGRTMLLLADGALGTFWELDPVAHEILAKDALEEILQQICKIFQAVNGPRVSLQFIFDGRPSSDFPEPAWAKEPKGFAQNAQKFRMKAIKNQASHGGDGPKLMRRRVFLTLRIEFEEGSGFEKKRSSTKGVDSYFLNQTELIAETLHKIRSGAKFIEGILEGRAKQNFRRCHRDDFVHLMRDILHELNPRQGAYFGEENNAPLDGSRLSKQLLNGHLQWSGDAVAVGSDTWEALSWSGQANHVFSGMMTELLKAENPIRCVVNIRPTHNLSGLEALASAVKNGGDAARDRQKEEVFEAEKRMAYGEKLLCVSLHIFYRNVGLQITDPKELRGGKAYGLEFSAATQLPLFLEQYAAFSVFIACLPMAYSRKVAGFVGRECRVLSGSVGPYLPLYAGTKGSLPSYQLMQSRAGEALWVNFRDAATNPHLAVLGSSGGGKSFWLANYIVSEMAQNKDTMVFHIDCITSCEYTAKALGEEIGQVIYKPPHEFPNIFRGAITPERLPTILSVLNVAVNLVSETKLEAAEKVLLSDGILKVYEDNKSYARNQYVPSQSGEELGSYEAISGQTRLPRLSSVVDSFSVLCQQKGISEEIGRSLREKLLPFFGSGPYSIIFDQETFAQTEERAPGYSLYDVQGIQGDRILTTLTSLIIISEIERIAEEPSNKGRKGILVIDELAVTLGGSSRELEEYVQAKWITLRKKGWMCIGLTNAASHYSEMPAPASIWKVSANKLILPMNQGDLQEAHNKGLIPNSHHVALIGSLQKKKGAFSEGLILGENLMGTFCYVPTGFDYWLAANQAADVSNLEAVFGITKSYRTAITLLAKIYPQGKTDAFGHPTLLTQEEIDKLEKFNKGECDEP